ncbi:KAP family NTPase [Pediococcus pentosaceus]|uniref:KAP family NTPase n=1 Tax=Pediococcus pentosaceus TaxID=1255 RepID=UPI0021A2B279|nr:KAP family NTPase [Pediococcus pentosaceus]MCT3033282.1 hypothetical protein [Pediococcus pentosaceus]
MSNHDLKNIIDNPDINKLRKQYIDELKREGTDNKGIDKIKKQGNGEFLTKYLDKIKIGENNKASIENELLIVINALKDTADDIFKTVAFMFSLASIVLTCTSLLQVVLGIVLVQDSVFAILVLVIVSYFVVFYKWHKNTKRQNLIKELYKFKLSLKEVNKEKIMNSNEIKDSIQTFATFKDEFAVMLDGAWGTGKTFFLQNVVKPELEKKHEFLYFSVYGFNSLGELTEKLKEKMFISSLGHGGNFVKETNQFLRATSSVFKTVTKKYPSAQVITEATAEYFIDKQLSKNKEKENAAVLVIDDLERMNKDIDKADFLGYVLTNIIECYGYRVIFVGNSKEMELDEKAFNRIKEKAISRVFPFESDIALIRSDFLDISKIDFVKNNAGWIQDILASYMQKGNLDINLRTLQFILNSYSRMEEKFKLLQRDNNLKEDELKLVKQSAFLNLFVVGNEYRKGKVTRDNCHELDELMNWDWSKGTIKNRSENVKLSDSIVNEYHTSKEFEEHIFYNQETNRLIFDGLFDAAEFFAAWSECFKKSEDAPNWMYKLQDYHKLSDQELKKLQDTVIVDIKEGKVKKLQDVLLGADFLSLFDKEEILFSEKKFHSDIPEKLKQLVKQSKKLPEMHILEMQYPNAIKDGKFNPLLKDIFNRGYERKKVEIEDKFLEAVFSGNFEEYNNIQHDHKFNIFREILDSDYLNKALLTKHNKASMLGSYLTQDYMKEFVFGDNDTHADYVSDVNELLNKVNEYLSKDAGEIERMDKYRLNMLQSLLEKIRNKLENNDKEGSLYT